MCSNLPEQQLPQVEPKHVCPDVPPHAPFRDTTKLAVGVLAVDDAVEEMGGSEVVGLPVGVSEEVTTELSVGVADGLGVALATFEVDGHGSVSVVVLVSVPDTVTVDV